MTDEEALRRLANNEWIGHVAERRLKRLGWGFHGVRTFTITEEGKRVLAANRT